MPAYSESEISNEELDDLAFYLNNTLAQTDTTSPTVELIWPQGTIDTDSPEIFIFYFDDAWGVQPASVQISLDGSPLSGCSVWYRGAYCDVYGLASGSHDIDVTFGDWAGNVTNASQTFSAP